MMEKNVYDPLKFQKVSEYSDIASDEAIRRDVYYSALTRDIVKNNRTSQLLKKVFFWVICAVFIAVCGAGGFAIVWISLKPNTSYTDLGVAITALGVVISAIVVLPKIIAQHLFPKDSEENRFKFVNSTQIADKYLKGDVADMGVEWGEFSVSADDDPINFN